MVKEEAEQDPSIKAGSKKSSAFMVISYLAYSLTPKVKAICSYEILVDFQQTMQCYILETSLWEPQILQPPYSSI
jgi:hypothetical protein